MSILVMALLRMPGINSQLYYKMRKVSHPSFLENPKKNDKRLIDGPHIFAAVVMGIIGIPIGWCLLSFGIRNYHEPMADFFIVIGIVFFLAPLIGLFVPVPGSSSGSSARDIATGAMLSSMVHKRKTAGEKPDVVYEKQKENLAVLEDMQQMHSVNPDADSEKQSFKFWGQEITILNLQIDRVASVWW